MIKKQYDHVWRVENSKGQGPYSQGLDGPWRRTTSHGRQPLPWDDGLLKRHWHHTPNNHDYIFGFKTIKDFQRWFFKQSFRDALHHSNLFLTCYHLPAVKIMHGERQSAFLRDSGSTPLSFRFCHAAGIMPPEKARSHQPIQTFIRKHLDAKGRFQKNDLTRM